LACVSWADRLILQIQDQEVIMAKLIYSAISSLDGYVADADGNFDWSRPDVQGHSFVNDLERPIGTYLYGRRTYEVMRF
jgi:dihydrofolate reductase